MEMSTEHRTETNAMYGGVQHVYLFPNGYGASVVKHAYSYGGHQGLWEVAVLDDGQLTYATPITSDVLGRLTVEEVNQTLVAIAALGR